MDVDTRLLRYFAAVAEEGTLSRAAERLFVSQPALTKQIKQLESQLGVRLFIRSKAGMTLTEAGRALAQRVPRVLDSWDEALTETRGAASRAAHVLRVGYVASAANEATQQIIADFGHRRPEWRVEMRQAAAWSNPTAGLLDREVDIALLRTPFPGAEGLRVEWLLTEPRCVALPVAHPLAGREVIEFRELWYEPFVAAPPETGAWRDFWLAADERAGHSVRIGAITDRTDDWLTAVANGYGIALAPESAARFFARPGIVYRPVTGVSPTHVAVVWHPTHDRDPIVRDFVISCLKFRQARSET
ncbi:LysR family transcriptional regulator [Nocardia yunnanensis]|uniref:LysR family transcriptional regulator n=1 Tax=Nocardia yunnanensis TaxID=2382165 RepID=A0A386ZKR7_9NOCA|nr:LysR family transcriptional regulator [Nocardia yunnanensis]AYF77873.1 LysR family transcriptional regulator [Nocardia yunnanensis]